MAPTQPCKQASWRFQQTSYKVINCPASTWALIVSWHRGSMEPLEVCLQLPQTIHALSSLLALLPLLLRQHRVHPGSAPGEAPRPSSHTPTPQMYLQPAFPIPSASLSQAGSAPFHPLIRSGSPWNPCPLARAPPVGGALPAARGPFDRLRPARHRGQVAAAGRGALRRAPGSPSRGSLPATPHIKAGRPAAPSLAA